MNTMLGILIGLGVAFWMGRYFGYRKGRLDGHKEFKNRFLDYKQKV